VDYPRPVTAYLLNRTTHRRHLAYFQLDHRGRVHQWGGALDRYPIGVPAVDMPISDILAFTEGMFPMHVEAEGVQLECVELSGGQPVDAHFFEADGHLWLLLLDARQKTDQRRLLQQKANDLQLLRDAHARILDQHLGKGMAERLLNIDLQQGAERRTLSILFADIRGFTTFCENRSPAEVFEMLNAYLSAMIRPVLDGGGVVDKIIGDAVMAVFGLVPSSLSATRLAVTAADEILQRSKRVAARRKRAGQVALGVGVGIATGPVVLGVLGSKDRRTLSVTGHPVNLAARLEGRAVSGEMLIDPATYGAFNGDRRRFSSKVLNLKGMACSTTAYAWTPHHDD